MRDLVRKVSREVRQALRHQRYRRIDLARDLQLPDSGRGFVGPQVNIMSFGYDFDFAGRQVTAHNVSNGFVEDLSIMCYDRSDGTGIRIDLNANAGLYDARGLAGHRQRFVDLLHGFADTGDPDRTVGGFALLSAEDRHRELLESNDTAHPTPVATLPALLAAQAADTPDGQALVCGATRLSYRELDQAADRLARRLAQRGAAPERTVAVALHRSADLVVALLAVLKTGAAYLPLDLDHPADRLALMLNDASPTLLVSHSDWVHRRPPAAADPVPRLLMDTPADPVPGDVTLAGARPANPAYVIYTSGSTGRPKGVPVPHQAIVNRLCWMQETYRLTPDDRRPAEDTCRIRRLGLGVLLAAADRGDAGLGQARRTPGPGVSGPYGPLGADHHTALRAARCWRPSSPSPRRGTARACDGCSAAARR